MKKKIEGFGGFEIVWMNVSRVGGPSSQSRGSRFPAGSDRNNVIVFIDRLGWSRRETNRVGVFVLSPGSEDWGSQLADSRAFQEELTACVRIVLKDKDGKSDIEVRHIPYMWADA